MKEFQVQNTQGHEFMSKPNFNHLLLSTTFKRFHTLRDLFLITYIWVRNTTIECTMKLKFEQHYATILRCLTKIFMILVHWITFLVHFTMLASHDILKIIDNLV